MYILNTELRCKTRLSSAHFISRAQVPEVDETGRQNLLVIQRNVQRSWHQAAETRRSEIWQSQRGQCEYGNDISVHINIFIDFDVYNFNFSYWITDKQNSAACSSTWLKQYICCWWRCTIWSCCFFLADNDKMLNYLLLMANNDKITDNFPIIKKKRSNLCTPEGKKVSQEINLASYYWLLVNI